MRKAKYDLKQVICPNASCIGHSSNVARPGYWVRFTGLSGESCMGRVLGRIAVAENAGPDSTSCRGMLAIIRLHGCAQSAGITWVRREDVTECYAKPPRDLFAWITGDDWVKSAKDIHRIVAMDQYGTLQEQFIASRNDPEKAYNARPEYVAQFILN